jgi:hypothetical protein
MKSKHPIAWLALAAALFAPAGRLAAASAPATNEVAGVYRSVFVLPTSPKEGRDPFFPNSTRTMKIVKAAAATTEKQEDVTALKCPGVSGTPGHMLAIINNHSFAVGDEDDVTTPTGKIHLRCVEIQADAVMVEINGRLHRITIGADQ